MECKECRFFVPYEKEPSEPESHTVKFGMCVFNPPVEVAKPDGRSNTVFPAPYVAMRRAWCGKFESAQPAETQAR